MKKGGLTTETVAAKLRELSGNMAAVARSFGVTRQAVWKFCNAREALRAVSHECRETMKDHAESALYKAVLSGEAWAVCFYLKTQAKDRGYIEKQELAVESDALGGGVRERLREVDGDDHPGRRGQPGEARGADPQDVADPAPSAGDKQASPPGGGGPAG